MAATPVVNDARPDTQSFSNLSSADKIIS